MASNIGEGVLNSMFGFGIGTLIINQIEKSNIKTQDVFDKGESEAIINEVNKRKSETAIQLLEAKVLQEISIANRIENAEIVEIEEYFEGEGKGNMGLSMEEKGKLQIGLSGSGQKIVKRVYRFSNFKKS